MIAGKFKMFWRGSSRDIVVWFASNIFAWVTSRSNDTNYHHMQENGFCMRVNEHYGEENHFRETYQITNGCRLQSLKQIIYFPVCLHILPSFFNPFMGLVKLSYVKKRHSTIDKVLQNSICFVAEIFVSQIPLDCLLLSSVGNYSYSPNSEAEFSPNNTTDHSIIWLSSC